MKRYTTLTLCTIILTLVVLVGCQSMVEPTVTPRPTATATDTPTSTPTDTPVPTDTPTPSPTPTSTPTSTPTATPTSTPTPAPESASGATATPPPYWWSEDFDPSQYATKSECFDHAETQRQGEQCVGYDLYRSKSDLDSALAELTEQLDDGLATELASIQADWEEFRDLECSWQTWLNRGGSMESPLYSSYKAYLMKRRTANLADGISGASNPDAEARLEEAQETLDALLVDLETILREDSLDEMWEELQPVQEKWSGFVEQDCQWQVKRDPDGVVYENCVAYYVEERIENLKPQLCGGLMGSGTCPASEKY